MYNLPYIATVADLQRNYRGLMNKAKNAKKPLMVVNNGKPDAVVVDVALYEAYFNHLAELEEDKLLFLSKEAQNEYQKSKSIKLKKSQNLLDLIK